MIIRKAWGHFELVCLLGVFLLLPHVFQPRQREKWKWEVQGENKVCGRNYSQFWQGLLSTRISESRPRSPAKHNISSILSLWQASIIRKTKRDFFFFPFGCPVLLMASKNLPWWIEALKPEGGRSKWRRSVRLCGSRSWVPENKRRGKEKSPGGWKLNQN